MLSHFINKNAPIFFKMIQKTKHRKTLKMQSILIIIWLLSTGPSKNNQSENKCRNNKKTKTALKDLQNTIYYVKIQRFVIIPDKKA